MRVEVPPLQGRDQVLTRLKSLGVTLSSFALKVAGIPEDNAEHPWNGTYPTARQFIERFTYRRT